MLTYAQAGAAETYPLAANGIASGELLLAMANLGAHPPLLAAELTPTFAGFLRAHAVLREVDRTFGMRPGQCSSLAADEPGRQTRGEAVV